ncbi:MAG TPA: glycoside hydrolase family 44 protein [Anaerolineaceae bacterium]|nr:glycoside hydrolase family 44 protein [Anaerolineaceae bacterium]
MKRLTPHLRFMQAGILCLALLISRTSAIPQFSTAAIHLSVDTSENNHPISPYIYGLNFADPALAAELHLPINRWGGNATTRYNWENDTSNRTSDWFFENIPNDNPHPENLPNGSSSDQFIEQNRQSGTQTLLTVPLIGWTPKNRGVSCGFRVSKYGQQQSVDPWQTDCGNGIRTNGSPVTGNAPDDTSKVINPNFVQSWINHLKSRYGSAAQGGVRFYNLDNEPMLWNSTHRDVHPNPTSYDELRDLTYAYGATIKAADPGALTFGPVEWGWTGYFYSALDEAPGGAWWNSPQDRLAHRNQPFVEWYLAQMLAYEQAHGVRILDYLDLHFYPQANNVALSNVVDANTKALRLRSTRALWDPTYTDESWINEPVNLIPRMRAWVTTFYPGTKIAISEYNWGALGNINGGLAEAEVLGIFGREGLDLATLWGSTSSSDPWAYAFRIYRNYDGAGSFFGETSVQATSTDPSSLSIFASRRAGDGALTLVVINKSTGLQNAAISVSHLLLGSAAQVYRYSSANLKNIVRLPDQPLTGLGLSDQTFPVESITLFVIPSASIPVSGNYHSYLPLTLR